MVLRLFSLDRRVVRLVRVGFCPRPWLRGRLVGSHTVCAVGNRFSRGLFCRFGQCLFSLWVLSAGLAALGCSPSELDSFGHPVSGGGIDVWVSLAGLKL